MHRHCAITLAALLLLTLTASSARGEHAVIDLRVIDAEGEASAVSDQEPPPGGVLERPVFEARAGEPLVLQFFLTNVYPHGNLEDVTVRYFVVRTEEVGQENVPEVTDETAIVQGEFLLDFEPRCRVGTRLQFDIPEAGIYLLRVETEHTQSDHEHFSAIDIVVE